MYLSLLIFKSKSRRLINKPNKLLVKKYFQGSAKLEDTFKVIPPIVKPILKIVPMASIEHQTKYDIFYYFIKYYAIYYYIYTIIIAIIIEKL